MMHLLRLRFSHPKRLYGPLAPGVGDARTRDNWQTRTLTISCDQLTFLRLHIKITRTLSRAKE